MNAIYIYMRCTDKEGRETVTEHRVWDAKLFMAAREADAKKEGGKASAQQITREDYDKLRAPKRAPS